MTERNVAIHTTAAGPVVELAGNLDYVSAPEARRAIEGLSLESGQQLLIDLSGLTFCDSSGLGVLIAARNHAASAQSGIALAAVPTNVMRLLYVAGLHQLFSISSTAQEATKAWTESAE